MNARQRMLTTLDHQEPDRVPLDLGATQVTGIHERAYLKLRHALDLPPVRAMIYDEIQGLALPDEDVIEVLGVDVRGLYPLNSHNWGVNPHEDGERWLYQDEWGITHTKPKPHGLYYSLIKAPLEKPDLSKQDIALHNWPDMSNPERIAGLRRQAQAYQDAGYAVLLKDPFAGIFEMAQRIVGMENLLTTMALNETLAGALFDKLVELKLEFWEMALPQLSDVIDVISMADDFGTQRSQLISPAMYRWQLKPRWKIIFARIMQLAPQARRFFHSCGNVRPLIPDFIEIGVQILNPIHIRAAGMEPLALKRDFGDALVFWGGGIDTQETLPHGTPEDVRAEVRANIDALAPGGGYIFNPVHNIQADVPIENLIAMWEAFQEHSSYV